MRRGEGYSGEEGMGGGEHVGNMQYQTAALGLLEEKYHQQEGHKAEHGGDPGGNGVEVPQKLAVAAQLGQTQQGKTDERRTHAGIDLRDDEFQLRMEKTVEHSMWSSLHVAHFLVQPGRCGNR